MAEIILVTGGSRSGKSKYAQSMAESVEGRRVFVATCPVIDEEMDERIQKHREARGVDRWDTIEETTNLASVLLDGRGYRVFLIDCLTLWINNLIYEAEQEGRGISEEEVADLSRELLLACRQAHGTVIFVTSEVGMGIVPDNPLSRRFRDLVGRCSQVIAAGADKVFLVTCGLPLRIK